MKNMKLATFLTIGCFVAVTSVMGFALIGNKWFSTPRIILIDQNGEDSVSDGDNGVNAVVSALGAWNGHAGNVIAPMMGNTSGVDLTDGMSMMVFDDPFKICTGSCLGVTTVGFTTGNTQTFNGVQFNEYQD